MVDTNFLKSMDFLLKDEGGNDDDPDDHGGRTSRGVTQKEYDAWRKEKGAPTKDVWTAGNDEIVQIYHEEYWLPLCDTFPTGIDYLYFDLNVNAGPHRAAVILQRALGVNDDGRIGPVTRQAVKDADPVSLIDSFTEAKKKFYVSLHQPKYTKGWLNRCEHVRNNAKSLLHS